MNRTPQKVSQILDCHQKAEEPLEIEPTFIVKAVIPDGVDVPEEVLLSGDDSWPCPEYWNLYQFYVIDCEGDPVTVPLIWNDAAWICRALNDAYDVAKKAGKAE